jgi:hypothetical protein
MRFDNVESGGGREIKTGLNTTNVVGSVAFEGTHEFEDFANHWQNRMILIVSKIEGMNKKALKM